MYAIIQHGGRQYRVAPGDHLLVDRMPSDVETVVAIEEVLFVQRDEAGSTDTTGTRVSATVIAHRRGRKLRVFKYKAKKRYRKTMGYRSALTELRIDAILAPGEQPPAREKPAKRDSPKTRTKTAVPSDAPKGAKPERVESAASAADDAEPAVGESAVAPPSRKRAPATAQTKAPATPKASAKEAKESPASKPKPTRTRSKEDSSGT